MDSFYLFLNVLHIVNDGYKASLLLLLPFIAKEFHLNLTTVGFLGTLVNSLTTILALPAGYLSGKYGGFKILLISVFIFGLGFVFIGLSFSFLALPVLFFITAVGFGAFHTIGYAILAKRTTQETRGKRMGEFTAIGDLGKISISTIVTTLVASIGWHIGAVAFGIVALVVGLAGNFLHFHDETKEQEVGKKETSSMTLKKILADKQFVFVNIANVLDNFASGSLFIFIPFLLLQRHIPLAWLGFFTALFFVGNISGKTVIGYIMHRFGNENVFIFSEVLMAIFIVILSNITFIPGIIIAAIILGVFTKGTSPILATMVSETADSHGDYEKAFAVNQLTVGVATMVAPIVLGFFSDTLGVVAAFDIAAVFALLAIIPALGVHWVKRRSKEAAIVLAESE